VQRIFFPLARRFLYALQGRALSVCTSGALSSPVPTYLINLARGENGSDIPVGYRIRIVQISVFRIQIQVFLYSGRIRAIPGYCSFRFGSDTDRGLPGKYLYIRVGYGYPEFGYLFFLFLHNIVIKL
jgi:hypothetical protein